MKKTIGHVITNPNHLVTFFSVIKAFSAFGNMIVVTFTTARVKQEIAKEGILPYSLFFAESYDISFGRFFGSKSKSKAKPIYHEKTPAATLALHWVITNILVIVPVFAIQPKPKYTTTPAYAYITVAFVYDIDVVYFFAISFGLLCLRLTPSVRWAEKSQLKSPWLSITSASILFIGCLFPLIFIWVPDPAAPKATKSSNLVQWWAGQTLAACLLAFAFAYWVAFRLYIRVRAAREGKTLHVKRDPIFRQDAEGLTQVFEIVTLQWKRDVGMRLGEIDGTEDGYRSETVQSSSSPPPPDGSGRLSPFSGVGSQNSMQELGVPHSRFAMRRKPIASELL